MWSRVYETVERLSVCLSVCLSRHLTAAATYSGFAAERRVGRRYRSTEAATGSPAAAALQYGATARRSLSAADASSVTLTADVGGWTQTCWKTVYCVVSVCFCQVSMILIVVVHLLCASAFEPLFAAHLNTHLCFAIFATQVARVNYYGLLDKWLACWIQAQKAWVQITVATLSGNSFRQTVNTHCASVHQAAKLVVAL